jgi:hypothetical protein
MILYIYTQPTHELSTKMVPICTALPSLGAAMFILYFEFAHAFAL